MKAYCQTQECTTTLEGFLGKKGGKDFVAVAFELPCSQYVRGICSGKQTSFDCCHTVPSVL